MKRIGKIKKVIVLCLIFLLSINSFATSVANNDGSAFITKAEFDALKSSFQSQIDTYNQGIDSKIDNAIASYLSGIRIGNIQNYDILCNALSTDGYIYSVGHSDLGFQAGWPNLDITYYLSAETKGYGGSSLAVRAHCILQTYENTTDDNKISKRLYLLNNTINGSNVLVYDGLYNIKDKISLINYYETTSVDIGFYASGQSTKLSVLTSHNNNDTNLTLNTWASNLYWIIGDLYNTYDTSQTYKRLYKNSKSEISLITNILKNVYPAVVLNDGTSTNKYMYWIGSNLSSNFQQPSSTTQNAAHNNLYYTSIDTMWSSLTTTAIYNNYMTDLNGWQTGTISFSVAAVGSYDNEYQRKNYTGRCWPIRMYNDVILLENVYQNDKTKYIYDKDDGTKETLTGYTLNSGVPIITVKKGDKVKWKADFVNNTSTSTSVTTTLQLRYGKFDDTNGSAVTGVSYNSTTKEYSFTATKSGIVFAKWTKGHALSVSTSRKITVESTPI